MGPDEMIPPAAPRFEEYEEHGQLIMIPPLADHSSEPH